MSRVEHINLEEEEEELEEGQAGCRESRFVMTRVC